MSTEGADTDQPERSSKCTSTPVSAPTLAPNEPTLQSQQREERTIKVTTDHTFVQSAVVAKLLLAPAEEKATQQQLQRQQRRQAYLAKREARRAYQDLIAERLRQRQNEDVLL